MRTTRPKELAEVRILAIVAGMFFPLLTSGQGTVIFANTGPGLNAPVYHADAITRLDGASYEAVLFAGPAIWQLAQVGAPAVFMSGANAGLFNGGDITINGLVPGSAGWFQVFAWDSTLGGTTTGATLRQAQDYAYAHSDRDIFGESVIFQNPTGGTASPTYLYGLTPFNFDVPEPRTLGLFGAGTAVGLLILRRKSGRKPVRTGRWQKRVDQISR